MKDKLALAFCLAVAAASFLLGLCYVFPVAHWVGFGTH